MTARSGIAWFVVILIATLALDQGSKAWAHTLPVAPAGCKLLASDCVGVPQPVIEGYWDWELAYNRGIAFSVFASFGGRAARQIVLGLLAALVLVYILKLARRTAPEEGAKRVGYALIAGGALGNLVDRVRIGAVTDFVRWRIHEHRWPIFNVADAALLIGVAVLLIASLRTRPVGEAARTV